MKHTWVLLKCKDLLIFDGGRIGDLVFFQYQCPRGGWGVESKMELISVQLS